jgi:hypothetical protein
MAILLQMMVCRFRGHDVVPVTHPNFPGLALLRCRRCHEGAELIERKNAA